MATLSLSSLLTLHSLAAQNPTLSVSIPTPHQWRTTRFRRDGSSSSASARLWTATEKPNCRPRELRRLRSAEDEILAPEQEGEPEAATEQPAVSVPVSASDTLTMFFQADGTMSEVAIPRVTQAFEEMEGISGLKIQVVEGIASVELEKLTTVQATGVASGLVESLQGSGFKLQTLQLSFKDQENVAV